MDLDISDILDDWPYERGQISARKVRGRDGKDKIQLRLDLGVLQMEATGRPDGERPHGCESLLAYYEHLLEGRRQEDGSDEHFELDERACELLRNEAMMFYHRYLAGFVLEDYEAVMRDTARNLRVMDFCNRYACDESDRYALEHFRPYVVMMRTRAGGLLALRDNRPKAALGAVKRGVREIEQFRRRFGRSKSAAGSGELIILRTLLKQIERRIPPDPVKDIKKKLTLAVKEERYEEAAQLRDRLGRMSRRRRASGDK